MTQKNNYAIVTGTSSGIGKECAITLAKKGYNLVLIARRDERLKELAAEIEKDYPVKVFVLKKDLSEPESAQEIFDEMKEKNLRVEVLINNAGYALYREFMSHELDDINKMLRLNIMTLTNLTWLFGKEMAKNGNGYILQLSSIGAFQPSPYYAAYSASKAYVMLLAEALDYEWKNKNVSVTTMYPGATETEFHQTAKHQPSSTIKLTYMSARDVAEAGINAMFSRKRSITPGILNKLMVFSVRLLPMRWTTAIAGMIVNPNSGQK